MVQIRAHGHVTKVVKKRKVVKDTEFSLKYEVLCSGRRLEWLTSPMRIEGLCINETRGT